MTDTNMTDTNTRHDNRWWCATGCGKRMRVTCHEENIVNRKSAWALVWVCVCAAAVGGVWFRGLLCSVWHNTSCVGCVGGDSRRVTPGCPFRTRLLSLWALMVLHLGGCGRVGYCQH